ncbi:MAG: PorV/PorQ family protein, partial [Candidatus Symbiothrix sp.]|nr:PorV/PorQ family protein [Candidatus Symbiothrix sp.]
MKRYFAIIMLIGIVTLAQGQSVPFLNFFSDARTAAMGNAGFAVASPFAVNRNTAAILLNDVYSTEIGASYLSWQPQVTNSTLINAAGYTPYGNAGFAAGIRYNTLDAIETTDEQGNVLGSFSPSEYAMEVGFGYRINPTIALGASLRYISSDLGGEKKTSAMAADISALYNSKNLSAGVGFSNVGSKIDYGNSEYALPARIQSGIAYRLLDKEEHSV